MEYNSAMDMVEKCRYGDLLRKAIDSMGPVSVRFLGLENGYQGFVDIDVECNGGDEDPVVVSYIYWYGSCSGCDEWEYRRLSDQEIVQAMVRDFTFFTLDEYKVWSSLAYRGDEDERSAWKQRMADEREG